MYLKTCVNALVSVCSPNMLGVDFEIHIAKCQLF